MADDSEEPREDMTIEEMIQGAQRPGGFRLRVPGLRDVWREETSRGIHRKDGHGWRRGGGSGS